MLHFPIHLFLDIFLFENLFLFHFSHAFADSDLELDKACFRDEYL